MFHRMYKIFSFNHQTFYYSFSKRTSALTFHVSLTSRQSEYLYFISSESKVVGAVVLTLSFIKPHKKIKRRQFWRARGPVDLTCTHVFLLIDFNFSSFSTFFLFPRICQNFHIFFSYL